MRAYSDPEREGLPHSLPDIEVFQVEDAMDAEHEELEIGWYYWFCFPGCLPDSEPIGPFGTVEEALGDVRRVRWVDKVDL
jgi:hypothetical protein